jgi:hypothetical protein
MPQRAGGVALRPVCPRSPEMRWLARRPSAPLVGVLAPTPEMFRGLARSSPWRWRALSFVLHRRPLHGPDHVVHGRLVRAVGLEVRLATGERHWVHAQSGSAGPPSPPGRSGRSRPAWAWDVPVEVDAHGFVVRRPPEPVGEDPMWQDYQFVSMLDPVELADGASRGAVSRWRPDAVPPPALDVVLLDTTTRLGRETWEAEVSPREEYDPRCACCPLLFGRVSAALEAAEGGRPPDPSGTSHSTAYRVALDVRTGVCVEVEHLDGDLVGRGFSLEVLGVDGG